MDSNTSKKSFTDKSLLHFCKVCGLYHDELPWGLNGNLPSFDYCACCGTEFGFHDDIGENILLRRLNWINGGFKWDMPKERPKDWSPEKQLAQIGIEL